MGKSALQEILEELQGDVAHFDIREYSGRGMYGKKCLSVVTGRDSIHSFALGVYVGNAATDKGLFADVEDSLAATQEDSMGLGSVMYWPRVPFIVDEE